MSRIRRYFSAHRWLTVAVAGTAVLALGAGVAYGAVGGGGATSVASGSPTTTPTTTSPTGQASGPSAGSKASTRRRREFRATITAISGSTWTVHTRSGVTVTLLVTSTTKFGTRAAPSAQSSFAVGAEVGVVGVRTGRDAVTASRVAVARTTGVVPPKGAAA